MSPRGHPVPGREAQSLVPSPGDRVLFPLQRVTGEGQGEGAVPTRGDFSDNAGHCVEYPGFPRRALSVAS